MNIPGFTAGESVYNTHTKYGFNTSATDNLDNVEKIMPQTRWLTSIEITGQPDGSQCVWIEWEDDEEMRSGRDFIGCS